MAQLATAGFPVILAAVLAQPPQPVGEPDPAKDPLSNALRHFEKAMAGIKTYVADVERITVDKTFRTNELHKGAIKFKRGGPGQSDAGSLYLRRIKPPAESPTAYEMIIWHGKLLYVLDPPNKLVRRYEVAQQDRMLEMFSAGKAEKLREQYKIAYLPTPPDRPDQKAWRYLTIEPQNQADKAFFSRAWLALSAETGFPGGFGFQEPNGNEVTWRFSGVRINVEMPANEFLHPVPAGWELKKGN